LKESASQNARRRRAARWAARVSLAACLGLAATGSRAESWEQLFDELKAHSPQLHEARFGALSAQLQVPQARTEPGAQFGLLQQANTGGPFDFKASSGFYTYYSFSQPLLWPGKLKLAGEVAQAQADIAQEQYQALLLQLSAQLKLAVYQLQLLEQQRVFLDEDRERLEQLKTLARVRYADQATAYVDFLNAQVSAGSLENQDYQLDLELQNTREQLNALLGRALQSPLELPKERTEPRLPARSLDALIEQAHAANPALALGDAQVRAADKSMHLAQKAYDPDFQFVVSGYSDPPLRPDTLRAYSVGVNLSLPTWFFRKEDAALNQAQAQLDAARAGRAVAGQQVELAVASAYHALETALRQLRFTRERLLPQAQAGYRLALAAYGNSNAAFSELLTAQSGLRNTELALIQAQSTALQAYVQLAAAIGRDPE
jgi:outer membrane protein TolC